MNSPHSKDIVSQLKGLMAEFNLSSADQYAVIKEEERRTELDFLFGNQDKKMELYFQITTGDETQFLLLLFKQTAKKTGKSDTQHFKFDFIHHVWISKAGQSYDRSQLGKYIRAQF